MRLPFAAATLLFAVACAEPQPEGPTCNASADADGDGLDDCAEAALGSDRLVADTDGDGSTDADEVDCKSDPVDGEEACYLCGWDRNDPGDLVSRGSDVGDVIDDSRLHDQCGERVSVWDFHGEYHVLYRTAAW